MAKVTQLGSKHIKSGSMVDMIARMEKADATIVIHLSGGKWSLQHMKGTTTIWSLIGILQIISNHFCKLANGD